MPNSEESLIFGDFTAEEWEKYFSSSAAQIGNSRAVEFLFDFEYSDPDEPDKLNTCKESDARGQSLYSDSAGAKNVPVGLEDSGVEVGQESEQESAPGKTVKFADVAKNSSDNVPHEKQKQEPPGQGNQRNNEVIEFGGKSIVEQTIPETNKGKPVSPLSAASRDEDSFPPLSSTVTDKQGEKPENERSRKRRKRRRQRKRSGSVSSSSSECNENERHSSNSPGSIAKSKTTCSLMTAEKVKADKDTTKVHVNVLYSTHKEHNGSVDSMDKKTESPRNSTSSCDGKPFNERKSSSSTDGTLNSPVQSDTDVKVTLNVSLESCSPDKNKALVQENEGLQISADQNKMPSDAHQQVLVNKEPPKLSSWADLFKSSSKPSPGIVIKVQSPVSFIRTETPAGLGSKKTEDPVAQTIVGIEEDKYAKRFAETIQKQQLNYRQKALIPRGLTNRGNWCYINATLQALVGCPPFFNLLRRLPFIKERGPTSTPILDSLISYMNEFKELVTKPANSSTAPKTEFKIDEPFEPSYVYRMLTTTQSSLSVKGRQEDAQEFLSCILNGVHEEMLQLSNLVSKPGNESETSEALTEAHSDAYDDQTAELQEDDGDWEEVGPRNRSMVTRMASYPRSLISDIFGGFLRSSVHQAGLKDSANVEPFFELQLDVQTVTSVEDALKNLALKEEVQGYTCTKTNVQVDISRRVSLEGLPKVLILHLKRFIYSKSGSQKLQKVIDYPLELTMGKELLSPNVKNKYSAAQKTYKLFAVVYHHGKNAWGGHYTSDVYHPVYGWIRADDTRLKTVPSNYVLKPTQGKDPYMLFYRRADLMP